MFVVDRVLADRSFAEIGTPVLAVADRHRGLLALAGAHGFTDPSPVGVYGSGDLVCRTLVRSRYPVHAMAFHPALPLLAIGTGRYDGGYFFEGELLLLDVQSGTAVSLIEHELGREVLGLEWLDERRLRMVLAPPDDWQDRAAWTEGHIALVERPDWAAVAPRSLTEQDLTGPRIPAPRPDGRAEAVQTVTDLGADWQPRRNVRAVEGSADGSILAALDGVALECRKASGEALWAVPDEEGGREIAVAVDGQSAWVSLARLTGGRRGQALARFALADGSLLDRFAPAGHVSLVVSADGRAALAPCGPRRPHGASVACGEARRGGNVPLPAE